MPVVGGARHLPARPIQRSWLAHIGAESVRVGVDFLEILASIIKCRDNDCGRKEANDTLQIVLAHLQHHLFARHL